MSDSMTRVIRDAFNGGRWTAQYFDTEIRRWFDIGDGKDTEAEAQENVRAYRDEHNTPASYFEPIVDTGGYLSCGCHGSQRDHTCGPPD